MKDFFGKHLNAHLIWIVILTFVMIFVASFFKVPGVVEHPQFTEPLKTSFIEDLFKDGWKKFGYYGFFILDFIWAPTLLYGIWKYVKTNFTPEDASKTTKRFFTGFTLIALAAIGFDYAENIQYFFNLNYSKNIALLKMAFWGLTLFFFVLAVIKYYLPGKVKTILLFLQSSSFSLIILAVIGVFLPKAPQVNSIIVNLYDHPLNFAILLIVAPIYAVVLSHYPNYFFVDKENRNWFMAKRKFLYFGTIFYSYRKNSKQKGVEEGVINFLRRTLGIVFYAALFYLIGYTSQTNFDWKANIGIISFILIAGGIIWIWVLKQKKDEWSGNTKKYIVQKIQEDLENDMEILTVEKNKEINIELMKIRGPVKRFIFFLTISFILHIGFFIWLANCDECRYTSFTAIWSLICILFQMISFVYYRSLRSVFRFVFFNKNIKAIFRAFDIMHDVEWHDSEECKKNDKKISKKSIKERKAIILSFFKSYDFIKGNPFFKLFSKFGMGALSNNVTFLQITTFIGILNFAFLILINITRKVEIPMHFNAILIILSALFFYYGVLVVLTKTYIYYRYSCEAYAKKNAGKFKYMITVVLLVLFISNRLGRVESLNNELFTLSLLDREPKDEVSLKAYVTNLNKERTRYYIGCYGGGMKSNAWTMTVLKHLYDRDANFFKKTVGVSGVSGGTMGLINMSAIINGNKNDSAWDSIIKQIATRNILSLDLTHILGRDTFNHMLVPGLDLRGKDRSSRAMDQYATLSGNESETGNGNAYRMFWKELYKNQNEEFPILISNTTNVKGNQGMAVSVKVENEALSSLLYQNADNILEIDYLGESKTLSYFSAASTSNRFPVISPAAKIETKGHFNDGGIYENSGLLSAYKLFRAINYEEGITDLDSLKQRNVFVNIVNDKNLYIKYFVEQFVRPKTQKVNKHTELNAILSSVASTEKTPIFTKTELQRLADNHSNFEFETIYLPHRFTVEDIKKNYGKEVSTKKDLSETYRELQEIVDRNDTLIKNLVSSKCELRDVPVIEPPMSRVMAVSAYEFMLQMKEHEVVSKAVNKIIEEN